MHSALTVVLFTDWCIKSTVIGLESQISYELQLDSSIGILCIIDPLDLNTNRHQSVVAQINDN